MYNHADLDYKCPFCSLIDGTMVEGQESLRSDIVYKDKFLTAFVSSTNWEGNVGRVLIIPNRHIENIYDIDEDTLLRVNLLSRTLAIALKKVFNCDGVTIRQHNEPASNQSVHHYHMQVIPRYVDDNFYPRHNEKTHTPSEFRAEIAKKLREFLEKNG